MLGKLPHKLNYIFNRIEVVVPVVVDIGEDFAVLVVRILHITILVWGLP
ncbi:unannotated protein [freshwater metagenome]|uniref:Unannotated protein n=1 Tax=freshwater metagenome TaxID=449393 RepID=A0A6J6ULY2_9ZZZZ